MHTMVCIQNPGEIFKNPDEKLRNPTGIFVIGLPEEKKGTPTVRFGPGFAYYVGVRTPKR